MVHQVQGYGTKKHTDNEIFSEIRTDLKSQISSIEDFDIIKNDKNLNG